MKKHTMLKYLFIGAIAALTLSVLQSCLPVAAGVAGGYILSKEGYKLQSPVTKD